MTAIMRILCRVVQRRIEAGEVVDTVLTEYPKLTAAEKKEIKRYLKGA